MSDKHADTVPMQPASVDIWERKYQLRDRHGKPVDASIDDTYRRVAEELSGLESDRQYWFDRFLWALRRGAIPAGRIISNAGAAEHKPATSTINCTVSGTVPDSMDGILSKVHEAGLTLKAGCGIGYEFSTLRPRGAYVSGAGAYTSGPLSFMDIYDKMCFTVSSAGARRGAQMATFDISHPDVRDFIKVKREDGRLRQFNLSLLITDGFMQAVANDDQWPLVFPIALKEAADIDLSAPEVVWRRFPTTEGYVSREDGLVAHRVYSAVSARGLWNMIMSSTYDFAEPGFILIDRVNEMNNNWWCENIRATNPCVTADTWVHTSQGPRQVRDLIGQQFHARVDGKDHLTGPQGFFKTATKKVVELMTTEGYRLTLTADHRVKRASVVVGDPSIGAQWVEAGSLAKGDRVLIHNHRQQQSWAGFGDEGQGYLLGLLVGDGVLNKDKAILSVWRPACAVGASQVKQTSAVMEYAERALRQMPHRSDFQGWQSVKSRNEMRMSSAALTDLAHRAGMSPGNKAITKTMESGSSQFQKGFLRGFFDADGSVQGSREKGFSIRLSQSDLDRLEAAQRMLIRLGVKSKIYKNRRQAGFSILPDGKGGSRECATKAQHELVISNDSMVAFADQVGFTDEGKSQRLKAALTGDNRKIRSERFTAEVLSVTEAGVQDVYDVQVPGVNTFDANGFHAHNCGEQPLPPYGACLLGSVNLTRFVRDPFTDSARFDMEEYTQVCAVFTRMLDNVVEINALPLERQRQEIMRKRRHGMGFLGLGSALAMLRIPYGSPESIAFTEQVSLQMALAGWQEGLSLAREKGPAPIMTEEFSVTPLMLADRPEMARDGYRVGDTIKGSVLHARYSRYMQRLAEVAPDLIDQLAELGARFTHHTSIAPTGTISLSLANNASNGIEPSFAHHYSRNVIREGKNAKEKIEVYSYELLAYRHLVDPQAMPGSGLPDYFVSADEVTPRQHVDIQAAAQKWIDSSISKTANVPTDYPFEDFKDIYTYAYQKGLKGCTTFRFNPEAFQGVLVKETDLAATTYRFVLEDGTEVTAKGNDMVEYEGQMQSAANLFDAIKEGYFGKF